MEIILTLARARERNSSYLEHITQNDRNRLGLYYRTLRDIPATQIFHKAYFESKSRLQRKCPPWLQRRWLMGAELPPQPDPRTPQTRPRPLAANALGKTYVFQYLNETVEFSGPLPWDSPQLSRLWRFHLHSFKGFGEELEGEPPREDLILDWIAQNPLGRFDGWHPYTTSLRIVAWVRALQNFQFQKTSFIEESLWKQLVYLSKNKEYFIRGNHLLENLRALIIGGCYFSGSLADQLVQAALSELCDELKTQILQDGGHFELSSMYHLVMMDLLTDVVNELPQHSIAVPFELQQALQRMIQFSLSMRWSDGSFPLWNDAAYDPKIDLDAFVNQAQQALQRINILDLPKSTPHLPFSGYSLFRNASGLEAAFDYGWPCPRELPGHAHADCLSIEVRHRGVGFVLDTGTSQYAAGPLRHAERSTRAHNTLLVGQTNQSEIWGSFRVGRKARPIDCRQSTSTEEWVWAQGSHDGYLHAPFRAQPHRWVGLKGPHLVILDSLSSESKTPTPFEVNYHWAPDVKITPCHEKHLYQLERQGVVLGLRIFGGDHLQINFIDSQNSDSWYAPEFGTRLPRGRLSLSGTVLKGRQTFCCVFGNLDSLSAPTNWTDHSANGQLELQNAFSLQWSFLSKEMRVTL